MPELIHTFTSGKMNKDLDERLVPNGEYRDAINLEISTSDGSDVGALQNIAGNASKFYRSLNPSTNIYTSWTSGFINELINPIKIGEIKDDVNEKIYWFIASQEVSAIAEYDQKNEIVSPILVDKNSILNFSTNYLITGINIIEGLLFWTDDQTEPKVININDFKNANKNSNFSTHSIFYGADADLARDFIESDITVIKQNPTEPLILELSKTRAVDANGNPAVVEGTASKNFVIVDPNDPLEKIAAPIGTPFTINWLSSPYPFYSVGDVLSFEGAAEISASSAPEEYVVRAKVLSVPSGPTQTSVAISILSVPETIQDTAITWTVTLEEDPFFEFKFPRFAYRYKYKDGYYSTFSTFSEVAFLPGDFDYEPKKGYNLGMVNQMKQCVIKGFSGSSTPIDVVEVDLLYKEANNQTIYVVDTFKRNSDVWNANEFSIKSEIISSVLPSNQILRVYDNVPRKAKAQEITANRLIYANYLQNFNLIDNLGNSVVPSLDVSISHNSSWDCIYDEQGNCTGHQFSTNGESLQNIPYNSVKTQRTYQLGVVFQDKYGRQTPVFTSESAATTLQKNNSVNYNSITVQAKGNKPKEFTNFRYYVKETSNEYYNLAMDRWYEAADGNIWISFSSSDRNKVDEETFLELKKRHDSSDAVLESAKYKIVAISNEAPVFLKETVAVLGQVSSAIDPNAAPEPEFQFFRIKKQTVDASSAKAILDPDSISKTRLVKFFDNQNKSDYYKISIIEVIPISGVDWYSVGIENRFGDDVKWMFDDSNVLIPGVSTEFSLKEFENKPEFEGRFFVKLYKDATLQQYLLNNTNSTNYVVAQGISLGWTDVFLSRNDITSSNWGGAGFFIDDGTVAYAAYGKPSKGGGFTIGGKDLTIGFAGIWPEGADFGVGKTVYKEYRKAVGILESVGGLFRFKEDPDGVVYKIKSAEPVERFRNYQSSTWSGKFNDGSNKRKRWYLKVQPVDPANGTGLFQGPSGWSPAAPLGTFIGPANSAAPEIQFLTAISNDTTFTSTNPAIFETEPKESAELEIYHSASKIYAISEYGNAHKLNWFNCYSFGNGVESDRIRDDFNAITIDNGPIVSAVLKEPYNEERRLTGLIFSQIFNSISGVNDLNQFIQAESITKDLNPIYSSIQKLHSRDTNLVTLCEDKCLRILANKDALFNADGNTNVTSNNAVLGQAIPYSGEFGISKNPESFASYGYRVYFTDKSRGVVIRLSNDGIEDISRYGMGTFFADNLKKSSTTWGSFDDDKGAYNVSLDNLDTEWSGKLEDGIVENGVTTIINPTSTVVTFKEGINAWESRKNFSKEGGITLNDRYYTFKNGIIWEHRHDGVVQNNFYGIQYDSAVTLLLNDAPTVVKKYKTLNYTGSDSRKYVYSNNEYSDLSLAEVTALQLQNVTTETLDNKGWYTNYIQTDLQSGYVKQFLNKENKWFQYIKGDATYFNSNSDNNIDSKEFSVQGIGRPYFVTAPGVSSFNVRVFNTNSSLDYNITELNFSAIVGSDLNDKGIQSLVITPNQGYTINYLDFSIVGTPTEIINTSFAQAGDNVIFSFEFADDTLMPSNSVEFALDIQGVAEDKLYTIQGGYTINTTNSTPIEEISVYSGSGAFNSTLVVLTKTVTANNGFYFFAEPQLSIAIGDQNNYSVVANKTYDVNQNLIAVQFVVSYTFPSLNVSGDSIVIQANAIQIIEATQYINAFTLNGAGGSDYTANTNGESLVLNLIGDPGALYSVELVDDLLNTTIYATNVAIGSAGTAQIADIAIPNYLDNKYPYELKITGDINPDIVNDGAGVTISISQQEPVSITITATSANSNLLIEGVPDTLILSPNTSYAPGSEPILNFSFSAAAISPFVISQDSSVTANSFSPVIPDPLAVDYTYSISNLTSSLNSENTVFTVSGTIEVSSSGATPITHVLDLDNILQTIGLPTIVTKGITNETGTEADSGGESITDSGGTISSKGIQWSEFADFNTILGANNEGTGTADFNSTMTGLTPGNTYYVRAYAQNEVGVAYGQVESFQTSVLPTLTTAAVVNVSWDSADSGGAGLSDNGSPITAKGIQWSTSPNFTTIEGSTNDGAGTPNFSSSLTGLTETTIYYVRAYATNAFGTGYGQTVSFQTIALPVTGLSWTTTVSNPCNSAPWTISNNNSTIRYDIEDSVNCGGSCANTQAGTATANITVGASAVDMDLDFEGIGEFQAANFEKISFRLNSVEVARANAAGGGQGCVMGPVVKTFITSPPYRLNANTQYTLFIDFTTNDAMYHVGAFYEVDLSFTNVP
jgi:hypothetical protein